MRTLKNIYLPLLLAGIVVAACSRDSVADVEFSVKVENAADLRAGGNVTFLFDGNADYITFYSGTHENNYANRERTEADMASLSMSCTINQQYNDKHYLNKEIIFAFLSTDFSGIYTTDELNKATWTPISGQEYNRLPVPVPASATATLASGTIDLGEYIALDKPFYVAFQYNAAGRESVPSANGNGEYTNRPRVDVSELTLQKTTVDGQTITVGNAITEWGFRPIYQQSVENKNYQVTDDGLLFQPQKAEVDAATGREPDEIVWMVSASINPRTVEPDRGTAIKSIEASLPSYTYTYPEPGEYVATFVATNANLWDGEQVVKQVTVTVNP